MTSKIGQTIGQANEAFVWIWLPGATKPVVAGRIQQDDEGYVFNYGASYLERWLFSSSNLDSQKACSNYYVFYSSICLRSGSGTKSTLS